MLFIFKLGEAKRASRSRWSTENSQDYLAKKPEEAGPKRQEGEGGEGKGAGVEGYLPTLAVSFKGQRRPEKTGGGEQESRAIRRLLQSVSTDEWGAQERNQTAI